MTIGILFDIGKSNDFVTQTDANGNLFSLDLDVTQDEIHEWNNDVTQFPVEIGSQITDHIQPMPDRITISGVISNSSIGEVALGKINNGDDLVQDAFDLLRKLMDDRILLTVYTRYKVYTDMALKSCNIPADASIGDSIKFKMEFVNVRLVNTQTIDVPDGISKKLDKKQGGKSGSVAKKTEPQKAAGKTEAKPVEKPSSALKAFFK
jgi:hypothetical protein